MIPITSFAGRRVAVFGLARSGLASIAALRAGGAEVWAWDDGAGARQRAEGQGVALTDLAGADWQGLSALVLAPGVPLTHPEPHWTVKKAQATGVPIIGDMELFYLEHRHRRSEARIVAITGTNGKSTTTALTAHVLKQAGLRVALGGNIGEAVLGLPDLDLIDVYVLELSSYQVDLSPELSADAAALLNLTPDHLDRHGSMQHYADVKERLVARAKTAVIAIDDDWCRQIAERRRAAGGRLLTIATGSSPGAGDECFGIDGTTVVRQAGGRRAVAGSLDGVGALRGIHNAQNALAAIALATVVAPDIAIEHHVEACRTFPGLAHRMQEVARIGAVLFVNDSKATNADSTEKALAAFDGGIYWILGGRAKAGGITSLAPYFGRVERAFLIGEASDTFAETLADAVSYERCGRLEVAVARAAEAAADAARTDGRERVVLLSPASASFDQFSDFEARGMAFIDCVGRLVGPRTAGAH
ncbi:MAG: UDP-N-acetylmuramoyl-L-alanine--D-glutamate ligase [Hyphomicrobiaceae bacterium]